MSSWIPTKYRTLNWAEYNLSLKQRGSLSIWFDPQMAWEAEASGLRGRQQTYSDAAIQACLTLKVLFSLPLRQTTGFVESLLRLVGLDWAVPDFSTLCRRQRTLTVALPYRGSAGPLHLLIDSTGIKAEGGVRGSTSSTRFVQQSRALTYYKSSSMTVVSLIPNSRRLLQPCINHTAIGQREREPSPMLSQHSRQSSLSGQT